MLAGRRRRGRRRDRDARDAGGGRRHRRRRRHRRPRQLPARARPAPQGALQPARRVRLRAVRRGRDLRAHRRDARAVPRVRGAARRPERQPPRRARGSARRPRPSWCRPTATSKGSSSTSTTLPPKQRQNLGEARDRVFLNREMSLPAARRASSTSAPATSARARGTASRCVCSSTSSRSARCARGCSRRSGRAAAELAGESATLDVDVATRSRRRGVTVRSLSPDHRGGRAVRARAAVGGRARSPARCARLAVAHDDGTATYVDAALLADPAVRDALAALVGTGGPPLVAHRAKELMHGLDARRADRCADDTAVMAYLLDPAEGKYLLDDLALRLPVGRGAARPTPSRAPSTSTARPRSTTPAGGRWSCCGSPRRCATRSTARELVDLYERFERPLVRVLARMEQPASGSTASSSRGCAPSSRSSATSSCAASTRTRARSST